MAKNQSNKSSNESEDTMAENTQERSESIDVGPEQGGNLLAAWRGVFHLLGGRAEFELVTGQGIVARNFSVNAKYNPNSVVRDVSGRDRRVDLIDSLPVLQGQEPPAFTEALEMTKWMQQYFRKPGEDGKSPQYIKDAIAEYKAANGFPGRRGRPKKIVRIENLATLDPSILAQLKGAELDSLVEVINKARGLQSAATAEATS